MGRVFLTHREDSAEISIQKERGGSLQRVPDRGWPTARN